MRDIVSDDNGVDRAPRRPGRVYRLGMPDGQKLIAALKAP